MEYLQYLFDAFSSYWYDVHGFKPYYKWNTFNTLFKECMFIPQWCFKPYYKWNTFNTDTQSDSPFNFYSFKPYYKWNTFNTIVDVMSW